jgi:hypothetical protein
MRDQRGYYDKFIVTRRETGEEIEGFKFTILPDDPHGRVAIAAYAASCEDENPGLASDRRDWLEGERQKRGL